MTVTSTNPIWRRRHSVWRAGNNVKDIKGREDIISSFNISRIEKRETVGAGVDDLRDGFYPGAQKFVFIGEGREKGTFPYPPPSPLFAHMSHVELTVHHL